MFLFFRFYWSIVNLQGCNNFCCTIKWPSHTYTHIHSLSDHFPTYIIIEYWVQFSALHSRSPLANHSMYQHVDMPNIKFEFQGERYFNMHYVLSLKIHMLKNMNGRYKVHLKCIDLLNPCLLWLKDKWKDPEWITNG